MRLAAIGSSHAHFGAGATLVPPQERLMPRSASRMFFKSFLRKAKDMPARMAAGPSGMRETVEALCSWDGSDQVLTRNFISAASALDFKGHDSPKNGLLVLNDSVGSFGELWQHVRGGANYTLKMVAFAEGVPFAGKPFLWWRKRQEYRRFYNKLNGLEMDSVSQGICTGNEPVMRIVSGEARLQHEDYRLYVVATSPKMKGRRLIACDLSVILVAGMREWEALLAHARSAGELQHWLENRFAHMEAAARKAVPHFEDFGISFDFQAVAAKRP